MNQVNYQYGIDAGNLEKYISNTKAEVLVSLPEYKLECWDLKKAENRKLEIGKDFEATVFVEEGQVMIAGQKLESQDVITLPPDSKSTFSAGQDSVLYICYGQPSSEGEQYGKKYKPFDFRDKYWGNIQTLVSKDYAAKRIFVKEGKSASLEFHCHKLESYYIHSGKLLLRFRVGRGEDRYFELEQGTATLTPPGLMHQRGGIADTVIIEISTRDEDSDSYLVEDGQKHPMPRLNSIINPSPSFKARICFDIDGVLRTQTKGDYENAKPIAEAVQIINKLYNEGYKIILYTSSFMNRNNNDQRAAYESGFTFNQKQMQEFGVKYHELLMGKPSADVVVDDRAVFWKPDWQLLEEEIRSKIQSNDSH